MRPVGSTGETSRSTFGTLAISTPGFKSWPPSWSKLKVDVLVSLGTPATLAAKRATTTIPIVMESLSDVVSIGLVPNLARPGGNVTGVSGFAPELSGKRLELIREIFPQAERIAVLANRANPVTIPILRATESAAPQIRMNGGLSGPSWSQRQSS
jgi:putative ABC transport system substrate-binding protein